MGCQIGLFSTVPVSPEGLLASSVKGLRLGVGHVRGPHSRWPAVEVFLLG